MNLITIQCFLVAFSPFCCSSSIENGNEHSSELQNLCDFSFHMMKEAYYEDDWLNCVKYGMEATKLYKTHIYRLVECRKSCRNILYGEVARQEAFLRQYGNSLQLITCINECKPPPMLYYKNLLERESYDYIQICHYKLGNYHDGASAAATFLVANPKHDYMTTNLANYKKHLGVKEDDLIDLEAAKYQKLYKQAVDSYDSKDWGKQLEHIVAALDDYHDAYDNCSLLCEAGHETSRKSHAGEQELIGVVADQVAEAVECKSSCAARLSRLDLKIVDNILLNIYHHLQYAYSQVGEYKKGAEFAAAFLLHDPNNQSMLTNKKYLMDEKNVPEDWFNVPEREARHKQRLDELAKLMDYLNTEYISQSSLGKKKKQQNLELKEFLGTSIKINSTAVDLGGTERFVADGFATEEQCAQLVNMCTVHSAVGDGYANGRSISNRELFQGLMVSSATQNLGVAGYAMSDITTHFTDREAIYGLSINNTHHLVKEGRLSSSLLDLYLQLSENARRYTQLYFNLPELHFDFTHLACRTALDESPNEDDLSHPVHSDNCILKEDGSCYKGPPAYIHRDYSGLLYLNDGFEGGEFFFTDNHKHEQSSVKPQCGRLVAFNAGDYHGVKAVRSGRRCAIAVWFTLDSQHSEESRIVAKNMLSKEHSSSVHDEL